mmetsp:Transcript_43974/g.86013  ORF Transcript_43974/g.86013 Transcript_43974/m.86013 type:complete len:290 (-) Transcript_43974:109-978(-)|eukprot:CAMPEP_0175147428 /NCGR_PEP_ID=MMETSP0087-20121206/15990_1 /TAXON_ID=136419 /ORGANISM="Unknown Unknown, Strain D1" /LENGTH=289 /DNA_ID=CAMNT_0016432623 /DNA_START=8 /DNA_END=877 /DNA_ORIENTATION=+
MDWCKLSDGHSMPMFGLGTWLSKGDAEGKDSECFKAVSHALSLGYSMIDTAQMYENEADVGAAVRSFAEGKEGEEKPADVFLVSKLRGSEHGRDAAAAALDVTLSKLQRSCVDLFLIHGPGGKKVVETWAALLELQKAGKIRTVGVSNFGVAQLEGLRKAGLPSPAVNQIELHPWLQQKELVAYCRKHSIAVMGYCPLARCKQFGKTKLAKIAAQVGKTEAEVCIRWSLQKGFVTIPKSSHPARIALNVNAATGFTLNEETMAEIETVDCGFKSSSSVSSQDLPWEDVK